MTAAATPHAVAPRTTHERSSRRAGDRGAKWRRRLAYVLLIGYALLMFVPFAWSVITSFKTLPDSVSLTLIPSRSRSTRWEYALHKLQAAAAGHVPQQRRHRGAS